MPNAKSKKRGNFGVLRRSVPRQGDSVGHPYQPPTTPIVHTTTHLTNQVLLHKLQCSQSRGILRILFVEHIIPTISNYFVSMVCG